MPYSADHCRAILKAAQAERKAANDRVRFWGSELADARQRQKDRKAAKEAGVDMPPAPPQIKHWCKCEKFYSHTDGFCDVCGLDMENPPSRP